MTAFMSIPVVSGTPSIDALIDHLWASKAALLDVPYVYGLE